MPAIVLTTLNAKYIHAAFGLRYLMANLGSLQTDAVIAEFDINQRPVDIVEAILAHHPRIVGIGIYIWNVKPATEVVAILKHARPDVIVILGGPEVSFEAMEQEIVRLADHVITGEADLKFAEVCRTLLPGGAVTLPPFGTQWPKLIPSELPPPASLELPYELYDDRDAAHRVIYVEASRGCPFSCEFCLSSLDIPVRQFALDRFLPAMEQLLARGVQRFKFVDRTFNLNAGAAAAVLEFFLERWKPGLFVHFEMVPDRLPPELRSRIAEFPPGALQFEIGVQTLNPEVEILISRRQNHKRLEENLAWLRRETGVHIHVDLIAGLPGETLESFAAGFDRLAALRPHEIQVGILKRLRGTPISRHDREWRMVYNPYPPYEILQTRNMDFNTLQHMRRFARYWDLYGNSGNFLESILYLQYRRSAEGQHPRADLDDGNQSGSSFWNFWDFCEWLHERSTGTSGISLTRQFALLHDYLTGPCGLPEATVTAALARDYRRAGRSDAPRWLGMNQVPEAQSSSSDTTLPRRQARHLARS